jgi:hypothetical protein
MANNAPRSLSLTYAMPVRGSGAIAKGKTKAGPEPKPSVNVLPPERSEREECGDEPCLRTRHQVDGEEFAALESRARDE